MESPVVDTSVKMGVKYAICEICNREMSVGGGCTHDQVRAFDRSTRGRWVARLVNDGADGSFCHDCNAGRSKLHHAGCDMETCPVCGGQAMGCECISSPEGYGEYRSTGRHR